MQTLKDCIDWSLPEISSSTVIVLEFKVCHDSKVLKKDLHHLATFCSIYFLSDDRLKNAKTK